MKKNERLSKELAKLSPKLQRALSSQSLPWYAESKLVLENGSKFSFRNHAYLFEFYSEDHPNIKIKKGTQLGLTTFAFIKALHSCLYRFKLGVIYFFPTKTDVLDFSTGRIDPYLKYNKHLHIQDEKGTDRAGLKRVGNAFIYFRGMKSDVGMKSVPADMDVFDEIDEAPQVKKEMALRRIDHSEFKEVIELSNPTIENYGIDREFQTGDMRYWFLKCSHCETQNSMDKDFPKCLKRISGSKVIRACKKCGKEIYIDDKGEWVPSVRAVSKDVRSYQVSQLYSHYVDPTVILNEFEGGRYAGNIENFRENFHRLRLGHAYTSTQNKLSKEQVMNLPRADIHMTAGEFTFMGMDHGRDIHLVVCKPLRDFKIGVLDLLVFKNFKDVDKYVKKFKTARGVGDALPEQREMRRLITRLPGTFFMNYYNEKQKGSYKWIEDIEKGEYIVQENRTESLDASTTAIQEERVVFSNKLDYRSIEMFAEHCSNIARKKETASDGSQRYVWIKTGADHFRHAFNYAMIAMTEYVPDEDVNVDEAMEEAASALDNDDNELESIDMDFGDSN